MANPAFISNIDFPLNEKPRISPENIQLYLDLFDILCALRLILANFVEEAPQDGKSYARKDGKWVEII